MTTDTKHTKTIFVSYSWSNGTQSGFGSQILDVSEGYETPNGMSEIRRYIEDKHFNGGTVVLIFWRELGSDAAAPNPP